MSTLLEILNKHGIKGLSVQIERKSKNNISRSEFKTFCKRFGVQQIGMTNSFSHNGEVWGFSMPKTDIPECRQFAKHYNGVVCKFPNGRIEWIEKESFNIGGITRIGPDGVEYFNAKGSLV